MISQETKQKISQSMPNRRRVNANGTIFHSVKKCSEAFNISSMAVIWRIRNWDTWSYLERE